MIPKSVLRTVIADQLRELESLDDSVPRTAFQAAASYDGASAFVVKGVRRCGKSTLLKQLMKARFTDDFYYFNFDDERVAGFDAEDFQVLMETFVEAFGERGSLFLDEVQNVGGWELFVNRVLRQGYRVFITGSNANLLSMELGTHLTGRHVDIELYPFSFAEFLRAGNVAVPEGRLYTTEQRALLSGRFAEYLVRGGMPEVVVFGNDAVLTGVLSDVVQRDIAERYRVRKPGELRAVLRFLVANAGNLITYRSLTENFGLGSVITVQKYVGYAEESYLVFTVPRYGRKIGRLDRSPRKVYCVDNGIVMRNAPGFMERRGALLENVVAVQLRRLGWEFYYFRGRNGAEADFVVPGEGLVIQVCYELGYGNEGREVRGLVGAMGETGAGEGLILTLDQERELEHQGRGIVVRPVWQWLLENEAHG